MIEIDLKLFLQIIQNEGCLLIWEDFCDDDIIYHVLSKSGNTKELIFGSDEMLDIEVAIKHLEKLEILYVAKQLGINL